MTFGEKGINIIKCENKEGNENLKKIHYQINEIFYNALKTPANKPMALNMMKQLEVLAKELKEVECKPSHVKKKNEILEKLRNNYKVLMGISISNNRENDNKAINTIAKYRLSQQIRVRRGDNVDEYINNIPKYIRENYEFINEYKEYLDYSVLKNIEKINKEHYETFGKKYIFVS